MTFSKVLSGKVALVTGASSGLGEQFAQVLASEGALVILAARRLDKLKALKEKVEQAGGKAGVVALDVTDIEGIRMAVQKVESEFGPIDILVNNSGVSAIGRLTDVPEEDFDFIMDTNVKGAFFVAQAVGKRMVERSIADPARQARIVNIASVAGLRVLPQIGVYCMSKAAVIHMTKAMAVEWGRYNINVNAICPGYIMTEMTAPLWESEMGKKMMDRLPRRRVGEPEDLDSLLLMLVSDQSRFINGSVIAADDGLSVT